MTSISKTSSRAARLLLIGCSSLALCAPAVANDVIFSSNGSAPQTGERTSQASGVTQIALNGGGTASIVDAADYTVNADGSIELHEGSVTVAGAASNDVVVRMPQGLEGRVAGRNSSANFTVTPEGDASGHALTGAVRVGPRNRDFSTFPQGSMWRASGGGGPKRVVANDPVAQPDRAPSASPPPPEVVAIGGDAGPVGAALNGIPVTLGDALASAGASGDIIAAGRRVEASVGNPIIESFPSGDLALLVAAAARLEGAYGGTPFNAAQADVIRTYLRFLANGGAGADFLAAYSGFALGYLDLIRAGGVPSGFGSGVATAADVDAYLAFIARTGALSNLAARDRVLADAYLAFLASGGNRDLFATSFTDLTEAYFAFIRAGGTPSDFTGASQTALSESIAFLQNSGLVAQLSAADQALVAAFLQNGGIAFAAQFETALDDYFAFLAAGRLPSDYTVLDQATLRAYLETLSNTGLLETVLADQAQFYADYLAFLRAGGDVDAFAGLPANIFAGYAVQLNSYFAFLAAGNLPTQFSASDAAQLQMFIQQLQAAGALDRFVAADQAAFFASFAQFVANGGAFNDFAGLNANIFAGYAIDLQAYFDFLSNGGIPSAYTVLSQDTIEQYLAALQAAGATDRFLVDLADFYASYFQFVLGGGNPDNFAGLPVPPDFPAFAAALNAYAAFLTANGLPSSYTEADLAQLQAFFNSVLQSGQLNDLLGANAALLNAYFVFLSNGGGVDEFAGLPVFADYVVQLNAYFAFLNGGGFPADYDVVDQATLNAFLAALANAQGGLAGFGDLNGFFAEYAAFVLGGGNPANFGGLPVYSQYVAALNAYFDFLAAGNLPSEYTVFDQATLEQFLAALAALQGGLNGFDDLNTFFVDYFAFLQNGGNPDQFAGLPGNGGGTGGIPVQLTGYTGGFDAPRATINIAVSGNLRGNPFTGGESGFVISDYSLAENGALQSYNRGGNFTRTIGNMTATDLFGNSDVLIGRWTDGTFRASSSTTFAFGPNQGLHYMLARQPDAPLTLPGGGRIDYFLTASTRPTVADGSMAPGVFDAQLALLFGTQPLFGIEGSATFDNNGSDVVYAFSTQGGIANVEQSQIKFSLDANNNFNTFIAGLTGDSCNPTSCGFRFNGAFGGNSTNTFGATYQILTGDARPEVSGAAIFEAGPERTFSGGSGGSGGNGGSSGQTANGVVPTSDTGKYIAYQGSGGPNNGPVTSVTVTDGQFVSANGIGNGAEINLIRNANTVTETDGDEGVIGWQRSENVRAEYRTSSGQGLIATPFAGQSWHTLWATPLVNLPASGLVNYDLIGSTKATQSNAQGGFGTFTGQFAVDFATLKAGLSASVEFGGNTYAFASNGGVTTPGMNLTDDGFGGRRFADNLITTQNGTTNVSRGTFIQGFLAGDGASHAGLTYDIKVSSSNGIQGAAAFQASIGNTATGVQSTASIAPSVVPIASLDWSRWGGTAGATQRGVNTAGAVPWIDPIAAMQPGADGSAVPVAQRDQAIEQAERLMGGTITWADTRLQR